MENPKKKTLGRRKIAIKKIEKKSSLQVAFTKRRGGLFRKASELAVLCGAEIAILVKSPAGKLYSFGQPSVEALINRAASSPAQILREYEGRINYEQAAKRLEAEKRRAGGYSLEQLLKSLEDFGENVEENPKNCAPDPLSIHEQPSSSNLIAADNFLIDAAPPLSLQQLIAADDFVIEADSFYDDEEGVGFFN